MFRRYARPRTIFCLQTRHCISLTLGEQLQRIYTSEAMKQTTVGTQHSAKLQLSIRRTKSRAHFVKSTISCLKARKSAILHNTRKRVHGRTWGWRHWPFFLGGGGIDVFTCIEKKVDFPSITRLKLRFVERNKLKGSYNARLLPYQLSTSASTLSK